MSAEAQVGLRFRVRWIDGRSEQLLVDADRALIGSAAHCEVRLPTEDAAAEHVEVFISEGVVHLTTRVADAPPTLDGAPTAAGVWPPGRILSLGGTTLAVDVVDLGHSKKGRSPFWLFAAVPPAALIAFFVYARGVSPSEPVVPEAPPLFDKVVESCPAPANDQVSAFATEKQRVALAKRERSPFSPRDGVDAVPLFETAAACFRVAHASEDEHEALGAGETLRRRLEDEYRARRVRLEHAFRVGDPFGAKRELVVLVPMTSHRRGPYAEWMASLDRYATLEIEQRNNPSLGR